MSKWSCVGGGNLEVTGEEAKLLRDQLIATGFAQFTIHVSQLDVQHVFQSGEKVAIHLSLKPPVLDRDFQGPEEVDETETQHDSE